MLGSGTVYNFIEATSYHGSWNPITQTVQKIIPEYVIHNASQNEELLPYNKGAQRYKPIFVPNQVFQCRFISDLTGLV